MWLIWKYQRAYLYLHTDICPSLNISDFVMSYTSIILKIIEHRFWTNKISVLPWIQWLEARVVKAKTKTKTKKTGPASLLQPPQTSGLFYMSSRKFFPGKNERLDNPYFFTVVCTSWNMPRKFLASFELSTMLLSREHNTSLEASMRHPLMAQWGILYVVFSNI